MPDDGTRLPDRVRSSTAAVMAQAIHVRVDPVGIDRLAEGLAGTVAAGSAGAIASGPGDGTDREDPWAVGPGDPEHRAALVLTLAALNFGSGYHDVVRKLPGCSGATTMATHWRRWAALDPDRLHPDALGALTAADAGAIFGQPDDDPAVSELMAAFAASLRELAYHVATHHSGSFLALAVAAGGDAVAVAERLAPLPHFDDRVWHHGVEVAFYKRAQLAGADLARAFPTEPPGPFAGVERLTAFADNLVPHVLRIDGALVFDPALTERIERGEPLAAGSPEEVEIRAAGVQGVEHLVAALADRGVTTCASELDGRLWHRGGGARFKAHRRHRTRSTFY